MHNPLHTSRQRNNNDNGPVGGLTYHVECQLDRSRVFNATVEAFHQFPYLHRHIRLVFVQILCRECRAQIFALSMMYLHIPGIEKYRLNLVKG